MLTLATREVLTTEEAREKARRALARAAMGGDPQRVKAERRAEMTVKELCELYMERLLALTGARKSEIACLRWSELDLDRGLLHLRDSKTGPKTIPLGGAALELLVALKPNDSDYLFPDRRRPHQPTANLDWAWVGIRRKAGLDDVRIHDLRHTFASAGLANGEGLPLIGKLLGHAHVATTSRYAHLAVRQVTGFIS